MIRAIFDFFRPVSRRRYNKSLEMIHQFERGGNDVAQELDAVAGELELTRRNLHYAAGDLAKKMADWVINEHAETIDIGIRVDKPMAIAAMVDAPEEFQRFIAQEIAAKVASGLTELQEKIDADALKKQLKGSKIVAP